MSLRFYRFDITANLCFESKLNKEQQMLVYVSMCLCVKSPPLSWIPDEWKSFENTFLEDKIETNVIWNLLMVCTGENAVYLRRHRQKHQEWSWIVWTLHSARLWVRGLYRHLFVVVSVFLLAILPAGDFFIFSSHLLQLSSKVLWSILAGHKQSRLNWEIFSDFQVSESSLVFVRRADLHTWLGA